MDTNTREEGRRALKGGAAAGIIGGIAIALALLIEAAIQGQDVWLVMKLATHPFLGARALEPGFDAGPVALGLLCHLAVSIVWGVLFASLALGMNRSATLVAGLLWGLIVWIGMYYIVLPLVGSADVVRATPIPLAAFNHLVFGLGLGIGFLPFQRPHLGGRPWWRDRLAGNV